MGINLSGLKVSVLGGDRREPEIMRLLAQAGATIMAYGCDPLAEKYLGKPQASSLQEAVTGADIILLPIPYPETDGSLFAPKAPQKIYLTTETLGTAAPNAIIITGVSTPGMKEAAQTLKLRLHEYENDEDLMILRSASIAEGAISIAVQHSLVSMHQSKVLLVGFGRIGGALGLLLMGMRARLHTATPLPIEQARAYQIGLTVYPFSELADVIGGMDIVFNTIPSKVFDRGMLKKLAPDALLIDIVAPPGGVDREAAAELGINFVWARGLGTYGPRTVAGSQWLGIERILMAELDRKNQD
jgi:dipicolinate synthase subunit A